MICPYRKKTETIDDTTSEYYMECYGTECPYYIESHQYGGGIEVQPYCDRKETEMFLATHPNYKGGAE